jgi:hypothetical protein
MINLQWTMKIKIEVECFDTILPLYLYITNTYEFKS